MITISKPKLLAIFLILITASISFYTGHVLGLPASTNPAVIEPGSMKSVQDYTIYYDNDNTTILAKNGVNGANDCKGTIADVVIQVPLTLLSSYCQLGGGGGIVTQGVKLFILRGVYLIMHTLFCNVITPV